MSSVGGRKSDQMRAVVLAGGVGARLAPYTTVLPKPLMPLGDMPILEILIRRLAKFGIHQVTLSVGHLASLISAYFGDGERFGVHIDYSLEGEPLGTAGPIRLVAGLDETFLVMNGDLLTDLDFGKMIEFHRQDEGVITVGLYERDVKMDLGVIEKDDSSVITGYVEKPVLHFAVSMGVYVCEPRILDYIPEGRKFDLPELVTTLIKAGERVSGYEHSGYWLDIGRPEDYSLAQEDYQNIRTRLLGA